MPVRLNLQTAAALIAGLLLVLAVINAAVSDAVLLPLGRMTYQGDPLVRMRASVPDIGPFESFNVNDDNPFIPYNLRVDEARRVKIRDDAIAHGKPIPKNTNKNTGMKEVRPPTPPPVLKYPRLPTSPADAPRAMGMIGSDANIVLLVRQGDGEAASPVPIGGTCNGWTLMAVEGGNQAVWEDPSGTRHTFPVGNGTLADPQALAEAGGGEDKDKGAKDKNADGKKKDAEPKAPEPKKPVEPKKDAKAKSTDAPGKKPATPDGRPPRRLRPPPDTPVVR